MHPLYWAGNVEVPGKYSKRKSMTVKCKFYITNYQFLVVDMVNIELVKSYVIKNLEVEKCR